MQEFEEIFNNKFEEYVRKSINYKDLCYNLYSLLVSIQNYHPFYSHDLMFTNDKEEENIQIIHVYVQNSCNFYDIKTKLLEQINKRFSKKINEYGDYIKKISFYSCNDYNMIIRGQKI